MKTAVKVLGATKDGFRVGGYGVVWGGQDTVGDYFTAETDFWFDRLTQTPMVLYQHGQDGMMKRVVVGRVDVTRPDEVGLWVEAQITAAKQYAQAIRKLVEKGVLGWSSGAVGYLVDRVKQNDGRAWLKSWPIAELSLTPTPAEPRTLGVQAVKALAGVDDALAALLDDEVEDGRLGATKSADPVWAEGTAARMLRDLAEAVADVAEDVARQQKALLVLGEDVKGYRRVKPELRHRLAGLIAELGALHQSAENADRDQDEEAAREIRVRRLRLIGA